MLNHNWKSTAFASYLVKWNSLGKSGCHKTIAPKKGQDNFIYLNKIHIKIHRE